MPAPVGGVLLLLSGGQQHDGEVPLLEAEEGVDVGVEEVAQPRAAELEYVDRDADEVRISVEVAGELAVRELGAVGISSRC